MLFGVLGRSRGIADPVFGAMGVVYSHTRLAESWEDFLDALKFPQGSPIRHHIRQLFSREDFDAQLQKLFEALCTESALTREHFERFSRGIQGHLHILTDKKTKIALLPPPREDLQWIAQNFDRAFPEERPLSRQNFPDVAKLVLLRRVVRTLIEFVGVNQILG